MPFEIIRNDITKMHVDVIVNATNSNLVGNSGVDGAIHKAAGTELDLACIKLNGCGVGEVKMSKGFQLPASYVFHTVGPQWNGGDNNEEELLRQCYRKSLEMTVENGFDSIAFPLISAGNFGYPRKLALLVAISEISDFLKYHDTSVYLVLFDKKSLDVTERIFPEVKAYIDDNYVIAQKSQMISSIGLSSGFLVQMPKVQIKRTNRYDFDTYDLQNRISTKKETFSQYLLRKIELKNRTDSEIYKLANVDRRLFSKIRSNPDYHPSKETAISFAFALELNIEETNEMLSSAGYVLSKSSRFDLAIEFLIEKRIYNICDVNIALYECNLKQLCS